MEIGTKIQFLKKNDIYTENAFLSHLIHPTGSTQLSNDDHGTINKLSISHEINENTNLGYNIGYNYFGGGNGDLTYSLSYAVGKSKKVGIYIEPYGYLTEFKNFASNFDTGLTYLLKENF